MNASSLVPDDLWEAIEPLLPEEPLKPKGGRPRVADRAALGGIVFVLRTGCPWRLLPKELGASSGTTCWRRLRDWQAAGVWKRLHIRLLNWLGDEAAIDWSRATVDSIRVRAKRGASRLGRTRLTGARPAPSTTSSSTEAVSRWPCTSLRPTPTMRPSSSRWLTPFRPSLGRVGDRAVLASARPNSTPTRPTIPRISAALSALVASPHVLLAVGSSPPSAWAGTGGWSSGRSRG
jgi:transposase